MREQVVTEAADRIVRALEALRPPDKAMVQAAVLWFTAELAPREQRIVRLSAAEVFKPVLLEFASPVVPSVFLRTVLVARTPQELAPGEAPCSLWARPSLPFEFRTGVLRLGDALELELRNDDGLHACRVSGKVTGLTVPPPADSWRSRMARRAAARDEQLDDLEEP